MTIHHRFFLFLYFMTISLSGNAQKIDYPSTQKVHQVDNYFGTEVQDPYRWLENSDAQEVADWVEAQNAVTFGYLDQITFREQIRERLEQVWNYPRVSAPFKEGEYYYFYKNDGLQNQSVLYRKKTLTGEAEVFLNPNELSQEGIVALGSTAFSKDKQYFAYSLSKGGSDWAEIYVMDTQTKTILQDKIEWVKFSGIQWYQDGFFYSRYDAPAEGKALEAKNEFHKVYYHKIGTAQSEDKLIYQDLEKPLRNFGASVTDDERFLFIYMSEGTSGNQIIYKDLTQPDQDFQMLIEGFDTEPSIIDNLGDKILLHTNHNAPNYKIILLDPKNPQPENWQTILPETKNVLTGASVANDKILANYLKDVASQILIYDIEGNFLHEVQLPTLGSVSGFYGEKEDTEIFYTFTSFTYPPTVYRYDIATNSSELYEKPEVDFDMDAYETKQIFYTSKDGTQVPMFIVHKKGLKLNGKNPTYLYAYGGFNISLNPSFSVVRIPFLEAGGIYVSANLRGGGEYGENWHKAGMLENKQNVFDDFIAAAEYLIAEKYTSAEKLAIAGGSNGGLLIGACINQRPDLFKVAIPAVGVMDMLRYHKFTIGWAWAVEYGSSEESQSSFENLYQYSPLHNLKEGLNYPAVLVKTADHDDRVVPAHSFKYIATLQEKYKGENPVLIRIDVDAGHGAGKPTSKLIDEWADTWAFIFYNMGINPYAKQK